MVTPEEQRHRKGSSRGQEGIPPPFEQQAIHPAEFAAHASRQVDAHGRAERTP